jgi:SHS2 domain-containing protein
MMEEVSDTRRGHRSLPHTADVILEAWGPDLAACCEEAVAALAAVYVEPTSAPEVARAHLHIRPADAESCVLAALEEVIFTLDTASAVPIAAEVRRAADGGLDMALVLADRETVEPTGSVPKAISRSGLTVEGSAAGVRCRVLVDV